MKKLMAFVLSFGLVLLGTAPVLAAGNTANAQPNLQPAAVLPLPQGQKIDKGHLKLTPNPGEITIPEPPDFGILSDEELQGVNGQGLIGAIAGGLLGMVGGALIYAADAAVGAVTGHCTANAHDFAATVAKSTAAGAAAGAILPEP